MGCELCSRVCDPPVNPDPPPLLALNIQYVALAALVIRYRQRRLSLLCYFACTTKIFHVCLDGMGPDKTITLSIVLADGCENWLALYLALSLQ